MDAISNFLTADHRRWFFLSLLAGLSCLLLVGVVSWPATEWVLEAMASVLLADGGLVFLWMASAAGWGWTTTRRLCPAADPMVHLVGGVIVQLLAIWILGHIGWLDGATAWVWVGTGCLLGVVHLWPHRRASLTTPLWPAAALLVAPSVALLLMASSVAPPFLWPSEHGAYDALSYHLQLPREWMAVGRVVGFEHNYYAYYPNLLEVGFMHLGRMRGSMVGALHAAQLLHAAMAMLAAAAIGRLVWRLIPGAKAAAWAAAGLYLAIPWTLITGSLAYNDQAVAAMTAAALLLVLDPAAGQGGPWRVGCLAGLFCGAAVLAKLTAIGMTLVPAGAVMLIGGWGRPRREQVIRILTWATVAGVVLLLWMIRNALWVGNPVFPFLLNSLGAAHLEPDQVDRLGSMMGGGPSTALEHLFSPKQGLAHVHFAYLIWPLAIWASVVAWRREETRSVTRALVVAVVLQILFWSVATHHQPRFLIPLLVPAAMLIGLGLGRGMGLPARLRGIGWAAVVVAAGVGLATTSTTFLTTKNGAAPLAIGGAASIQTANPDRNVHAALNDLGPDAKIYAEGFATPFYITTSIAYHTVWDRSPLGEALAAGGPAEAHRWLLEAGFTHVIIDWGMLERWWDPKNYGYDPNITPASLRELTVPNGPLKALAAWQDRPQRIYRVRPLSEGDRIVDRQRRGSYGAQDEQGSALFLSADDRHRLRDDAVNLRSKSLGSRR